MKIANLVVAIVFTIFYFLIAVAGIVDAEEEIVLGIFLLSPPVILNWITFAMWDKQKK